MLKLLSSLLIISLLSSPVVAQEEKDVVAVVGSRKITKEEYERRYKEVVNKTVNPPPRDLFLEDLIRYEVGVQEAQKRNLEKDPVVQERIRQVLYVDLVEKELGKKVDDLEITEKELQNFYAKNPEIRTSHILIEVKPNANRKEKDAAKKRANDIYNDVRKSASKPFEQLAKLYSDDVVSKKNGGDIGWHTPLTLVPEYYQAAAKLGMNQMSGLVETMYGYHIIKLTGKKSYQDADKVKMRAAVLEVKKKALFDGLFNKLKAQYQIKTYPNHL